MVPPVFRSTVCPRLTLHIRPCKMFHTIPQAAIRHSRQVSKATKRFLTFVFSDLSRPLKPPNGIYNIVWLFLATGAVSGTVSDPPCLPALCFLHLYLLGRSNKPPTHTCLSVLVILLLFCFSFSFSSYFLIFFFLVSSIKISNRRKKKWGRL